MSTSKTAPSSLSYSTSLSNSKSEMYSTTRSSSLDLPSSTSTHTDATTTTTNASTSSPSQPVPSVQAKEYNTQEMLEILKSCWSRYNPENAQDKTAWKQILDMIKLLFPSKAFDLNESNSPLNILSPPKISVPPPPPPPPPVNFPPPPPGNSPPPPPPPPPKVSVSPPGKLRLPSSKQKPRNGNDKKGDLQEELKQALLKKQNSKSESTKENSKIDDLSKNTSSANDKQLEFQEELKMALKKQSNLGGTIDRLSKNTERESVKLPTLRKVTKAASTESLPSLVDGKSSSPKENFVNLPTLNYEAASPPSKHTNFGVFLQPTDNNLVPKHVFSKAESTAPLSLPLRKVIIPESTEYNSAPIVNIGTVAAAKLLFESGSSASNPTPKNGFRTTTFKTPVYKPPANIMVNQVPLQFNAMNKDTAENEKPKTPQQELSKQNLYLPEFKPPTSVRTNEMPVQNDSITTNDANQNVLEKENVKQSAKTQNHKVISDPIMERLLQMRKAHAGDDEDENSEDDDLADSSYSTTKELIEKASDINRVSSNHVVQEHAPNLSPPLPSLSNMAPPPPPPPPMYQPPRPSLSKKVPLNQKRKAPIEAKSDSVKPVGNLYNSMKGSRMIQSNDDYQEPSDKSDDSDDEWNDY